MATYSFSTLADGAAVDFVPGADRLSFAGLGVGAAALQVEPLPDGSGLRVIAAGKSVVLEGLTLWTLHADSFAFDNGSRVLSWTAQATGAIGGTAAGDLLIGGSGPALPLTLASVAANGLVASGGTALPHDLSADGRLLLFVSSGGNLVGGDTNGQYDLFVHDLRQGITTRVSLDADGSQLSAGDWALNPSAATLSDDGSLLFFTTFARLPGGATDYPNVYAKDLVSGALRLVSADAGGTAATTGAVLNSVSADGRWAAFTTASGNLGPADLNGTDDVYVKDLRNGAVQRASQGVGIEGDGASSGGLLSADGRWLVFTTAATNLVADANGIATDVLRRDLRSDELQLVSTGGNGQATDDSVACAVSADGRVVLFWSVADNLIDGDTLGERNLFARDLQSGLTVAVDASADGELSDGRVGAEADLSANGRWAVFTSSGSNLVPGGTAGAQVYVKDLVSGAIEIVSRTAEGQLAGAVSDPRISADGSTIGFSATGPSLDPRLPAGGAATQTYAVANPLFGVLLQGGAGNDRYVITSLHQEPVEAASSGTDTVVASISYTLGANLENLELAGSADLDATGNTLANVLVGNAGNNRLDGVGTGNTASYATATEAVIVSLELAGTPQDTVGAGIDTLIAIQQLIGSAFDDTLAGGASGAELLDGGAGADWLVGGPGNTTYVVDSAGDLIDDAGGTDTVRASVSTTLAANLEQLVLTGSRSINATGNALANVITSNAGSNRIDGGGGIDTVSYAAARSGVVVGLDRSGPQATGAGLDTLISIEQLIGSPFDDTLHGSATGSERLEGGGGNGADTLSYARAGAAVTVSLATAGAQATGGGGTDTVQGFVNLVGSAFADTLTGSAQANRIDGGVGADTMAGGGLNDTYVVDSTLDVVTEVASGGTDTIETRVSIGVLAANVENVTLLGSLNLNATGNDSANRFVGNSGANVLDGAGGTDLVSYTNATDAVNVNLATGVVTGGGGDTLISIESVTGSDVADTFVGSSAGNVITGGKGADLVTTGNGADTVVLDGRGSFDTVSDFASGTDKLRISQSAFRAGDGDTSKEGAIAVAGPGGFSASAELVIVAGNASNASSAKAAAMAIGSASSGYAVGASAIFVVDDGSDTGVWRFVSSSTNAAVQAGELTLLALLDGTASTTLGDYLFGG